ncbi:MAG: DUF1428 domain-containing protein [Nitrososphaeraceae archaeon]|nr:DUF1428 domain-containing protein [Nitrososphaeraceae archaeon]MDW0259822.1 DUF1428 domain-containing protein [Nitrososphaeraceae archaeon]
MKKNVKPKYVDGFVLAVPKNKINAYLRLARICGKIWLEHGALEYNECVGDDLKVTMGIPFPKMIKIKSRETVVFSWITYKSRAHRNSVNSKVMKDSRMKNMDPKSMPFDPNRLVYGGFKILVSET